MKQLSMVVAIATLGLAAISTSSIAADVGVSISVGQPGFYGQIDIGNYPQPQLIYAQPRIIERVDYERPPIYLRVPPGHAKHWSKHCREYNACGERVLFVRDGWYNREYVPRYQEQHGGGDGHRGDDRNGGRGDDDHGDRGGNNGGKEHGHGHGKH